MFYHFDKHAWVLSSWSANSEKIGEWGKGGHSMLCVGVVIYLGGLLPPPRPLDSAWKSYLLGVFAAVGA